MRYLYTLLSTMGNSKRKRVHSLSAKMLHTLELTLTELVYMRQKIQLVSLFQKHILSLPSISSVMWIGPNALNSW